MALKNGDLNGSAVYIKLLGVDISEWPQSAQFIALSVAVFVFYIAYGYMQVAYLVHGSDD